MARISKTTTQILAQNDGRDAERLAMKLALMRQDAFAFFRGANPLYLTFMPRRHTLFRAPTTLVCGDLHTENFGAFKGDNRLCYFDVNDFDEACLAPFSIDLVRFLSCIYLYAEVLELGARQARRLRRSFLSAYCAAVADGKPRWIERSLATGAVRALLQRAMKRTRPELLDRFSKSRGGERRIRIDGERALALLPGERARLKSFLAGYGAPPLQRSFFRMLDAARRNAGNGSLGLPRYLLLVRGRGSPDRNFALDLKFAAPSAVAAWLGTPQPRWRSESERVAAVQRIVQAIPPALLRAVRFQGEPFVLKELQPSIDRLRFKAGGAKPRRLSEAMQTMGSVAAWAHMRGCGRLGAAPVESLQAYVAGDAWQRAAEKLAEAGANKMRRAWAAYCRDFDAIGVEGLLKRR